MQAQDAPVFGTNQSPIPTSYLDKVELRMGYIEVGNAESDPISVRVGPQELNFGEQRMIGYNGWRNTAQSFDAVRLILRRGNVRLDIFASGPVLIQDRFNRVVPGNNLHGVYGTIERRRQHGVWNPAGSAAWMCSIPALIFSVRPENAATTIRRSLSKLGIPGRTAFSHGRDTGAPDIAQVGRTGYWNTTTNRETRIRTTAGREVSRRLILPIMTAMDSPIRLAGRTYITSAPVWK